jgi:thiol-disulfide isomerase/thioredoxin
MGLSAFLLAPSMAAGQDEPGKQPAVPGQRIVRPAASDENLQAINDDYNQELLQLEHRRMERLVRLAGRQNPADAAATYEQLFRLAIAGNLFREAEPAARTVVSNGSPSVIATGLAHLVKIIAESDRGAYEQSIESLRQAIAERERAVQAGAPRADLPTDEIMAICDAYYQRMLQGAQFENARKALQIIFEHTRRPALKEFLSSRLKRLEMVGKPAPPIQGTDLDGKPFSLADARGKAVLVVFWASWCLPCVSETELFQQLAKSHGGRGLQIVGINLDAMSHDGPKLETVLPNVRRFLLDHNVGWPTLINGQADTDFAKAYHVTELPANVLIAKNGTIAHIDLVRKNLEPAIIKALSE